MIVSSLGVHIWMKHWTARTHTKNKDTCVIFTFECQINSALLDCEEFPVLAIKNKS